MFVIKNTAKRSILKPQRDREGALFQRLDYVKFYQKQAAD